MIAVVVVCCMMVDVVVVVLIVVVVVDVMLVVDQWMMRCVDDVVIGLLSIQVGLKVTMRWGCEFLISIVNKKQEAGEQGQDRGRDMCQGYVPGNRMPWIPWVRWSTVGQVNFVPMSLLVFLAFSPSLGRTQRKRRGDRGCAQHKRNDNACPPLKVHTPQRYVPLMYFCTPAAHTQAAITETGPVTATGERQGARNYGKSHLKRKQTTLTILFGIPVRKNLPRPATFPPAVGYCQKEGKSHSLPGIPPARRALGATGASIICLRLWGFIAILPLS